ncbi:MAG: flgC [Rickettsiales bacterium]|jgi:flagellar basal-body rod protein FlgC|nr:flgC [Rickettsiales bacterium]
MTDLKTAMRISAAGMRVQSERLKVSAQNIANVDSTGSAPGAEPYRRKTITFENVLDRELGVETVRVQNIGEDQSPFKMMYDPSHVAADQNGYVLMPNVSTQIETVDAKEAQRSYEANVSAIEVSKTMLRQTLDMLR